MSDYKTYPCGASASGGLLPLPDVCPFHGAECRGPLTAEQSIALHAEVARLQAQLAKAERVIHERMLDKAVEHVLGVPPDVRLEQAEADRDASRAERDAARKHIELLRAESDERHVRIVELTAERDRARQQVKWQSIETAPKDGTMVLLCCEYSIQDDNAPRPFYCVSRWVTETREYWEHVTERRKELRTEDASHWENWEAPTHWMPLPKPPSKGE